MATATVTSRSKRRPGMSVISQQGPGEQQDPSQSQHERRAGAAERRKKVKQLESENKRLRDALDERTTEATGVRFKCQDLFDVTVRGLSADKAKELEETLRTFVDALGPSSASELLRRRLQSHASTPQVSQPASPHRPFEMQPHQIFSVMHRQFGRDYPLEGPSAGGSNLKYSSEQDADSVGFDFNDTASLDELFSVSEADLGGEKKPEPKEKAQTQDVKMVDANEEEEEEEEEYDEDDDDDGSVDLLFTARQQDPESVRAREREYDAMMADA